MKSIERRVVLVYRNINGNTNMLMMHVIVGLERMTSIVTFAFFLMSDQQITQTMNSKVYWSNIFLNFLMAILGAIMALIIIPKVRFQHHN